jgi:hypothetical protein
MPRETDGTAGITATGSDTQPLSVPPKAFGGGPATARFTGAPIQPQGNNATAEKMRVATAPLIFAWGPTATGPDADPVAGSVGPPPVAARTGDPNNVRPSLIRITIELSDPNGRLTDGQRMEFVFRLK